MRETERQRVLLRPRSVSVTVPVVQRDPRAELREHFAEMGIALRDAWLDELLRQGPSVADVADYFFKNTHKFRDDAAPAPSPAPVPAAVAIPAELRVFHARNASLVESVLALGFPLPLLAEALRRASSVEAVVEYVVSAQVDASGNVVFPRDLEEAQARCGVCQAPMPVSELLCLDCDHRMCGDCFEGFCCSKITEGQVSEEQLSCPCIADAATNAICREPLCEHILRANLTSELMDRYDRFKMRSFCENAHMCRCVKCNDWFVDIPRGDSERDVEIWKAITCGKCAHVFCGRCGAEPHRGQTDLDMSCEEFARRDEDADQGFAQWRQDNLSHRCPGCGHCTVKGDGCNYLYCRCKTDFCNLCGVRLNRSIKFEHFFDKPYGDKCRGVAHGVPN